MNLSLARPVVVGPGSLALASLEYPPSSSQRGPFRSLCVLVPGVARPVVVGPGLGHPATLAPSRSVVRSVGRLLSRKPQVLGYITAAHPQHSGSS